MSDVKFSEARRWYCETVQDFTAGIKQLRVVQDLPQAHRGERMPWDENHNWGNSASGTTERSQ